MSGRTPLIARLVTRVRAILAPAFRLSILELAIQGVVLLGMVVKFRYFGAAAMGLISYFGALGEVPAAFYSHFSRGLVRFLPTASPERRVEIVAATAVFQGAVLAALGLLLILLLAAAPVIPGLAFWRGNLSLEGRDVAFAAAFTVALVPVVLVQNLLGAVAQGFQKYGTVQGVKLFNAVALLAGMVWLSLSGVEARRGLLVYYVLILAANLACCAYLALRVRAWMAPGLGRGVLRPARLPGMVASVYREQFKRYTLPLQATAVLAFLKENLAVLFLGQMGMMADAGVYNLANKIYALPRRFIPNMVGLFLPKLVLAAEADPAAFRRKYDDFAWIQFLIHLGMGTALLAATPLAALVFDAGNEPGLAAMFFLFSSNLVINAVAHNNLHIIELGKDMRRQLRSAAIRVAVVVAITAFLVPRLGNTGGAVALLLSTVVIWILQALDTRGTRLWSWNQNIWQALAWLAAMGAWALLFILFPGTYPLDIPWRERGAP